MIWFLPALLGCTIAHAVLLPAAGLGDIRPDLFLLLVFVVGRRSAPETATLLGLLIGLWQDGLSGGPLGLRAFTGSLMGFLVARLSHQVYTDKPRALFWLLLGGSAISGGITFTLLTFFLGLRQVLPAFLWVIAPEALFTAAVGLLIFWLPPFRAVLARPA